jgi:DinB superfamily
MQQTANHLLEIIEKVLPILQKISEEEAQIKPLPTKWSKKEIVGHLIDSACNNQQKFVRMMAQNHLDFVGYEQDFWVENQAYNAENWQDLLQFWAAYNRHLAHIIVNVSSEKLQNTISINGFGSFTLAFIMADYVEHLKHHLKQALPDADFLKNSFSNIYNT